MFERLAVLIALLAEKQCENQQAVIAVRISSTIHHIQQLMSFKIKPYKSFIYVRS